MPKQIIEINPFHGGLNNNGDPRDIKVEELSQAQDIMIDEIGKVRMMGSHVAHDAGSKSVTIEAGKGLFYFSHDRLGAQDASSAQAATGDDYLAMANSDGGADIEIYSNSDDSWSSSPRIDLGSDSGLQAVYYYADGNLRVGDADFTNTNNRVQWYGYIDRYFYGDGTSGLDEGDHDNGTRVNQWHTQDASPEAIVPKVAIGNVIASANLPTQANPIALQITGSAEEFLDVTGSGDKTSSSTDKIKWRIGWDEGDDKIYGHSGNADIDIGNFCSIGDRLMLLGTDGTTTYNGTSPDGYIFTVKSIDTSSTNHIIVEENLGGGDDASDNNVYITNLSKSSWFSPANPGFQFAFTTLYDDARQESALSEIKYTGTHTGSNNQDGTASNPMVDSAASFTDDQFIQWKIKNVTDGSEGIILDNDGTTVDAVLAGGTENLWDTDDEYEISTMMPGAISTGSSANGLSEIKFIFFIWAHTSTGLHNDFPRVSGFRVYMRRENTAAWYLQTEIDVSKGAKLYNQGGHQMYLPSYSFTTVVATASDKTTSMRQIETYETETGYDQENINVGFNANGLGFKTAVVAGRRAYVGNVVIKDSFGSTKVLPDAILKSAVNKFDTFTFENRIEANVNDGSSIIKLEEYADRLLEFKQDKMTLINISQNVEFLEDVFMHKGVVYPCAVCKTDYGIAWANEHGCYLYDGQRVNDLLEKGGVQIIKESTWSTFIGGKPMVGYIPKKRQILVASSAGTASDGDIYLYDLVTKSWVEGDSKLTDGVKQTNFVSDWNGDLVHAHTSGTVLKWSDTSYSSESLLFATKDMTFGQPGQRKKLHKVYITYKGDGSNTTAKYAVNGETDSSDFKQFNSSNTPLEDKSSSENLESWHLAELKPSTSSEANNIYSAKFHLSGRAGSGFEINDINVVFRMKNIK